MPESKKFDNPLKVVKSYFLLTNQTNMYLLDNVVNDGKSLQICKNTILLLYSDGNQTLLFLHTLTHIDN